jgi:hypothetical protein
MSEPILLRDAVLRPDFPAICRRSLSPQYAKLCAHNDEAAVGLAALDYVLCGLFHSTSVKIADDATATATTYDDATTFDSDLATRVVLAAHMFCVRMEIGNGGPRRMKISAWKRDPYSDRMYMRHPDLAELIERATKELDRKIWECK